MIAPGERFAAIDVGSNGIRLVVAKLNGGGAIRAVYNERQPVRLGADAFGRGRFGPQIIARVVAAFKHFRETLVKHDVQVVKVVATSAARESSNADRLIAAVYRATGITIEIIDGLTEAQMVFDAVAAYTDLKHKLAVLVDMGGGSVEITVVRNGRAMASESLRLGPVRLMQQLAARGMSESDVPELIAGYRAAVTSLLRAELNARESPQLCIGTGGNIECLAKLHASMLDKPKSRAVKLNTLDTMTTRLLQMSVTERRDKLGLRADRADVIAIAAVVLRMIMRAGKLPRLLTPGIGLKEGLLYRIAHGRVVAPEETE